MDKKPSYLNAITSAAQIAAANSFNDDPYSIELDRLDVFDVVDNQSFMNKVIEAKKSLVEEAKMMRKMMRLDEITPEGTKTMADQNKKFKKTQKATKVQRRNIEDDDYDETVEGNAPNEPDTGKADEEASDEEEVVEEDLEEDNDYMDAHFDNGEDYAD